jgi:flagellar basal-body rod protein FlgG
MIRALRTAATGMYAQELFVDTVANNLANLNTTGFKKAKVEFQDLLYQTERAVGVQNAQGATVPVEIQIGHGTRPVAVQKIFSQGDMTATNNALDIAIDGSGFLQVLRTDGTIAYSRDGALKLAADGRLVTSDGLALEPEIVLPPDAVEISISAEGVVSVRTSGDTEAQEAGQIDLARFVNPAGLKSVGSNLYEATAASGQAFLGNPGSEGFGGIMQGYLEMSNVDVVEEMMSMIVAQRAYEINSKAIKTAEEMLSIANDLRR